MKKLILPPVRLSKELSTIVHNKDCALHQHVNCEFLLLLSGKATTKINDTEVRISAGDLLFINDKSYHTLTSTDSNYAHRDVYISSTRLKDICDVFFDASFFNYLMSEKEPIFIPMGFKVFSSFADRLNKLQSFSTLYPEQKQAYEKSILVIIISFLGILYESHCFFQKKETFWLQDFLITINEPEIFTLPIKEIISRSHYSHSYFSHVFRSIYHQSFKSYIDSLKTNYAKNLLTDPNMNIIEISYLCGYSSQSHFTQAFKKSTGFTPKEYRNKKFKK